MQLDMTKGKIMPILLRFTIPLMIGNMFQQLYNMVDTIIVGRFVGAGALAAVGSTGTIMFLTIRCQRSGWCEGQCRQWNPSVHHFFHFDDGFLSGDHASASGSDEYACRHF